MAQHGSAWPIGIRPPFIWMGSDLVDEMSIGAAERRVHVLLLGPAHLFLRHLGWQVWQVCKCGKCGKCDKCGKYRSVSSATSAQRP